MGKQYVVIFVTSINDTIVYKTSTWKTAVKHANFASLMQCHCIVIIFQVVKFHQIFPLLIII